MPNCPPSTRSVKALRERTKKTLEWVVTFTIVLATAACDPFGLNGALESRSRDVAVRAAAPFYEVEPRDQLTVVLADDAFLEEIDEPYPFSRFHFATILDRILIGKPAGAFLDFHFPAERDAEGSAFLANFVHTRFSNAGGPPGAPTFFAADVAAPRGVSADFSLGGTFPVAPVRIVDDGMHSYPMCVDENQQPQPCEPGPLSDRTTRMSPAVALFSALHCASNDQQRACAELANTKALVLRWPRRPAQNEIADGRACERSPSGLRAIPLATSIIVSGVLNADFYTLDQLQPCSPYLTISAADLDTMSEAALRDAFEDRAVFIGSHFNNAPDRITSPVHGQLPGVFSHAAAYENLLGKRLRLWRENAAVAGVPVRAVFDLAATGLMGLIALFSALTLSQRCAASRMSQRIQISVGAGAVAFIVAVLFGLVFPWLVRLTPSSFYGHLVVTVSILVALLVEAVSIAGANKWLAALMACRRLRKGLTGAAPQQPQANSGST